MLIMANDSGVSCGDIAYMIISIILMVIMYGIFPLAHYILDNYYFLWFFSVYIIYVIWSCCHDSSKYINHLKKLSNTFNDVQKAIEAPPEITLKIQNYHYVRTTDSKGRSKRRRVNTHYAEESFKFEKW